MSRSPVDYSSLTELHCRACGQTKPVAEFGRYADATAPLTGWRYYSRCKECNRAQCREYGASHRAKRNKRMKTWRKLNPEKEKALNRRAKLRANYGLSEEQHAAMVVAQDGRCAICQTKTKLLVDHCHKTGAVRKLLCTSCNTIIGRLETNPLLLQGLRNYLDEYPQGSEPIAKNGRTGSGKGTPAPRRPSVAKGIRSDAPKNRQ